MTESRARALPALSRVVFAVTTRRSTMAWTKVESALALLLDRLHEVAPTAAFPRNSMTRRVRARMAAYKNRGCATLAGRAWSRCRIARDGAVLPLRWRLA